MADDPKLTLHADGSVTTTENGERLTGCDCHSGHQQNDTVCLYCWAHGRRHWNDPDVPDAA